MNAELIDCNISHAEQISNWANDLDVRKNAFNSNPIEWADHVKWFEKKLASQSTKLYILKKNEDLIGQIRFDLNEHHNWLIDYSIDKNFRGQGLGKLIIQLGIEKIKAYSHDIIAEVKVDNIASIQVFSALGFRQIFKNNDYVTFEFKINQNESSI